MYTTSVYYIFMFSIEHKLNTLTHIRVYNI